VALCRHRVTRDANLWFYTTTEAADDFADVLHALGYRSANLIGASYGTRVAMVMVRRHPAIVRSLVLQGVSPVDHRAPLTFAADAQAALDRLLSECQRTPDCAEAFPRIRAEAASVIERFAREPVRAQVRDPDGDGLADVAVSKNLLGEVLQWMLYTPPEARRIPALLHRVASGDASVVAERALGIRRTVMDASGMGLYLSVMCAEDLPRIDPAAAAASAEGTFLGDYRYREQKAACVEWPQVAVGADFYAPIDSRVPNLVLSGELDPVTPPRLGDSIGSHFTNGVHLYVPYGGHSFDGLAPVSCLSQIRRDFIERGTANGLDTGCLDQLRPPPFEMP
jgi:pimeloyl-ACP methyl ester carboxylesterase